MALYFVLKKSKRGLAQILTGTYEYEVAFQDPDNHSSLSYSIASCTRGKNMNLVHIGHAWVARITVQYTLPRIP